MPTISIQDQIQSLLDDLLAKAPGVPGFVAGVWWDGQCFEVSGGTANLNTGAPMTTDTAYLLGSITKVLVTSLLMRFVDRGAFRLDDRVAALLPELRLGDGETLEALRVRHLLNHTSGIDAADYMPDLGQGADAIRRYIELLANKGQLYPLGRHWSYCNPAFVIAGRILEVLSEDDFDTLLKRELLAPLGMERTCTSGDEAILHRTAIGHIVDPATNRPRPTRRFMLPYSLAPAGARVVTTVADLLRFARLHLDGGLTPEGDRLLASESVAAMATETVHVSAMGEFGMGLGWMLPALGATPVLWHTGGSYGGYASLLLVPDQRFACAAFGNANTSGPLHLALRDVLLQQVLGLPPAPTAGPASGDLDPSLYTGTYAKFDSRTVISPGDNGSLVAEVHLEYEESQRDRFREYSGRDQFPPIPLYPVTESVFALGAPPTAPVPLNRIPTSAVTFLDPDENGRFRYLSSGLRISRRVSEWGSLPPRPETCSRSGLR